MKKEKNVFLTTIGETRNRLDIDYFACLAPDRSPVFTTGVSVAEAGIKYMLSQVRLDEIIVLGDASGVRGDEMKETGLAQVGIDSISDLDGMSEYGFLNYRIAEYMNQVDFELLDIGEALLPEEKAEAKERVTAFRNRYCADTGKGSLFPRLCQDRELAGRFEEEVLAGCRKEERKWLKHSLFDQMDSFYKMHMLAENRDTSTRFIPIITDGVITIESITKVVRETLAEEGTEINLYMDIQGLGATDGNTLISTFLLLNRRIGYSCRVHGLISSRKEPAEFAGRIRDVLKSYEIQNLISGLDLFLEYGKVDPLKRYWNALGIDDPDAERLFTGMDCIDEGISLCNVDLIAVGINVIRRVFQNPLTAPEDRNIYMNIVLNAIRADYGKMLDGDELAVPELLKWCHRKKLYQQTLTIIESKVPEDIVKRGIYYYARHYGDIKKMMKVFNELYWNEQARMRYAFNNVDHYFIKIYGRFVLDYRQKADVVAADYARLRVDALHGNAKDILPAFSQLNDDDLLYELLYSYYRLGNLRNMVNHAIVDAAVVENEGTAKRKDSRDDLDVAISSFIELYTRACEKTRKTSEPMLLEPRKMKGYVRYHELQPLTEENENLLARNCICQFNGKEVMINIRMHDVEQDNKLDEELDEEE